MSASWPWFAVAGLGAYHGLNPAMGWLFAVALGLHRGSRAVVVQSLPPIAIGHALSIALTAGLVLAAGFLIDPMVLKRAEGGGLILWAVYHLAYGARHRVRVGMQTSFAGLVLWSFLMAGAHGAGLMLVPALIPLCLSSGPASLLTASSSMLTGLAAVALHTLCMLLVIAVVAIAVYQWIGVGFLRRGWINLDLLWTAALCGTGIALVAL